MKGPNEKIDFTKALKSVQLKSNSSSAGGIKNVIKTFDNTTNSNINKIVTAPNINPQDLSISLRKTSKPCKEPQQETDDNVPEFLKHRLKTPSERKAAQITNENSVTSKLESPQIKQKPVKPALPVKPAIPVKPLSKANSLRKSDNKIINEALANDKIKSLDRNNNAKDILNDLEKLSHNSSTGSGQNIPDLEDKPRTFSASSSISFFENIAKNTLSEKNNNLKEFPNDLEKVSDDNNSTKTDSPSTDFENKTRSYSAENNITYFENAAKAAKSEENSNKELLAKPVTYKKPPHPKPKRRALKTELEISETKNVVQDSFGNSDLLDHNHTSESRNDDLNKNEEEEPEEGELYDDVKCVIEKKRTQHQNLQHNDVIPKLKQIELKTDELKISETNHFVQNCLEKFDGNDTSESTNDNLNKNEKLIEEEEFYDDVNCVIEKKDHIQHQNLHHDVVQVNGNSKDISLLKYQTNIKSKNDDRNILKPRECHNDIATPQVFNGIDNNLSDKESSSGYNEVTTDEFYEDLSTQLNHDSNNEDTIEKLTAVENTKDLIESNNVESTNIGSPNLQTDDFYDDIVNSHSDCLIDRTTISKSTDLVNPEAEEFYNDINETLDNTLSVEQTRSSSFENDDLSQDEFYDDIAVTNFENQIDKQKTFSQIPPEKPLKNFPSINKGKLVVPIGLEEWLENIVSKNRDRMKNVVNGVPQKAPSIERILKPIVKESSNGKQDDMIEPEFYDDVESESISPRKASRFNTLKKKKKDEEKIKKQEKDKKEKEDKKKKKELKKFNLSIDKPLIISGTVICKTDFKSKTKLDLSYCIGDELNIIDGGTDTKCPPEKMIVQTLEGKLGYVLKTDFGIMDSTPDETSKTCELIPTEDELDDQQMYDIIATQEPPPIPATPRPNLLPSEALSNRPALPPPSFPTMKAEKLQEESDDDDGQEFYDNIGPAMSNRPAISPPTIPPMTTPTRQDQFSYKNGDNDDDQEFYDDIGPGISNRPAVTPPSFSQTIIPQSQKEREEDDQEFYDDIKQENHCDEIYDDIKEEGISNQPADIPPSFQQTILPISHNEIEEDEEFYEDFDDQEFYEETHCDEIYDQVTEENINDDYYEALPA